MKRTGLKLRPYFLSPWNKRDKVANMATVTVSHATFRSIVITYLGNDLWRSPDEDQERPQVSQIDS